MCGGDLRCRLPIKPLPPLVAAVTGRLAAASSCELPAGYQQRVAGCQQRVASWRQQVASCRQAAGGLRAAAKGQRGLFVAP